MKTPSLFLQQAERKYGIPKANPLLPPNEVLELKKSVEVVSLLGNSRVAYTKPIPGQPLQKFPKNKKLLNINPVTPTTDLEPPQLTPNTNTTSTTN